MIIKLQLKPTRILNRDFVYEADAVRKNPVAIARNRSGTFVKEIRLDSDLVESLISAGYPTLYFNAKEYRGQLVLGEARLDQTW